MESHLINTGGLLDVDAAAVLLGCTPRNIRELVARQRIPVVRIGRLVRFRRADLEAFVDACRRPATTGPLGGDAA